MRNRRDDHRARRTARTRWLLGVVVVIGLVAAACTPPEPDPDPAPPPATCASGGAGGEVLTHAGGPGVEDAALPVFAVTRDEVSDELEVVTYGAEDFGDAADFAEDLEADPDTEVVSVEVDEPVELLDQASDPERPAQWALDNVAYETAWNTHDGSGVKIAVVDTGVRADHEDLAGKVVSGANFTTDGQSNGCSDVYGHGTHVAGIAAATTNNGLGIAGGAKGAKVLPVKVLGDDGWGSYSWVISGIIWATENGADVINMSLGGGSYSDSMRTAVQDAVAAGVVVVAAAGNSNSSDPSYPAGFPETIAVASTTSSNERSSFSNYGSNIDVAAPGTDIISSHSASTSEYRTWSGTSMASPYVAAAAALVIGACPSLDATQVEAALEGAADDLGSPGWDQYFGHGLIDPAGAVTSC